MQHGGMHDPIALASELDDEGYEVRKVEIFANGFLGFASEQASTGSTFLGDAPIPPDSEILKDAQFSLEPMEKEDFERIWEAAISGCR